MNISVIQGKYLHRSHIRRISNYSKIEHRLEAWWRVV